MMSKFTARQIKNWDCSVNSKSGWIPARPVGYTIDSLIERLNLAWLVFTGRLDALDWEDDQ